MAGGTGGRCLGSMGVSHLREQGLVPALRGREKRGGHMPSREVASEVQG